eukprot:12265847-Karenia_brevis.AAC.1
MQIVRSWGNLYGVVNVMVMTMEIVDVAMVAWSLFPKKVVLRKLFMVNHMGAFLKNVEVLF